MGFFPANTAATITVVVLLCFSQPLFLQAEKAYSIQFQSFDPGEPSVINDLVRRDVTFTHNAMQLTPDTASEDTVNFKRTNNSGRVFLKKSFRLWGGGNSTNARVASFNSSFRINIYPQDGFSAEGLTFLIAPNTELPNNSFGQYLGLTNASTDGNAANKIVAVELDTNKQWFDPDGNHVGIDINGVRSVKVESLSPHGIVLAPNSTNASFYNVWVQYGGVSKVMEVYIGKQETQLGPDSPKPDSPVLKMNLDLRKYLNQESYFGFSASTGDKYQLNCVLRWSFTINYFPEKKNWWKIVVGVCVPLVLLFVLVAAWFGYKMQKRRKMRTESAILGALKSLPGTPREFEFKDLKKATDNFDEKKKLGQGGYGVVYKGCLAGENLETAVKLFSRESIKGQDDFLAELTVINRLRHKNLVKLLGWCHKYGKLLLVYEYMPHGSLDEHLFSAPEQEPLSWELRYKIMSGVASALQYLHNEFEQRVVHRDLKASNVMLDTNFNARLGDFGLARVLDNERTSYAEAEGVLGTMGYIAPECFHTGKATRHSDVYAFGAMLLEVVCGQRPGTKIGGFHSLVDWVWYLHRVGRVLEAVDERLRGDYVIEEAERLLLLGLACSHPIANERPRTCDVVQIILGSIPAPIVPPFKPSFVWPSMVPIDIDSTEGETTSITTTSHFSSGWTPHYVSEETNTGQTNSLV